MKEQKLKMLLGVILALLPFAAKAQTFDALWTQFDEASQKDLPATALKVLHSIRDKAANEKADAQLLRALVTECAVAREISADSGEVVLRQIERAMQSERRPVERALWLSAYGQLTDNADSLMASIAQPEVLADARTADYATLFEQGEDSRWEQNDLLGLLTRVVLDREGFRGISPEQARTARSQMRRVYEQRGYTQALLLMDYDEMLQKDLSDDEKGAFIAKIRQQLPQLKGTHARTVLAAYIHNEENAYIRASMECPTPGFYPGKDYPVSVTTRNCTKGELRVYRMQGVRGIDLLPWMMDDGQLEKFCKTAKLKSYRTLAIPSHGDAPAHVSHTDTLQLQFDAPGIYRIELCEKGKIRDFNVVYCTRVSPLLFSYAKDSDYQQRLQLMEAQSGEPLRSGIKVQIARLPDYGWGRNSQGNGSLRWESADVAPDGSCLLPHPEGRLLVAASAGDDQYLLPFYAHFGHGYNPVERLTTSGKLFTDRAVYRPGQSVHFGGLVYQQQADDVRPVEGWAAQVVLLNPQRKVVCDTTLHTRELGDFNGTFQLPDPLMPGVYQLRFAGNGCSRSVALRVEEYKRPTFRVELAVPRPQEVTGRETWQLGDTLTLSGSVKTWSGIPVAGAKVSWTTERSLSLWRSLEDAAPAVTGETVSEADGTFKIPMCLREISDETAVKGISHPWFYVRFRTQCDVTAANGESVVAAATVVARQAVPEAWRQPEAGRPEPWSIRQDDDGTKARLSLREAGAWAYYDVVSSEGGHIFSRQQQIADSIAFDLEWQPDYGDAAIAYLGWMKDGVFSSISCKVERPRPDKRLLLSWSTFRDKLQPGQEETWTLSVRKPDGSAADALVMARLYDASLDAFARQDWSFELNFPRHINQPSMWVDGRSCSAWLAYYAPAKSQPQCDYTHWRSSMFSYYARTEDCCDLKEALPVMGKMRRAMAAPPSSNLAMKEMAGSRQMADEATDGAAATEETDEAAGSDAANDAFLRENFDETAFFMPALRTDADGNVSIAFTLPESLTQWNFSALAHDANMNFGLLHDTIVAQREIMVEVAAPRFLRDGDVAEIPVTVRNVSSAPQRGTLRFLLADTESGAELLTKTQAFEVERDGTATFRFTVKANLRSMGISPSATDPTDALAEALARLTVRATACTEPDAEGRTFSDGEQRAIPLLSGRVVVETAVPFSFDAAGSHRVDLKSLGLGKLTRGDALCKPELSVEFTGNPLWSVVRCVPGMLDAEALSANDAAVRLYIVEVARSLSEKVAEVRAEMPASTALDALRHSALDCLRDRQHGDGGFSWLPGFPSSFWVTADVSILLARAKSLTQSRLADEVLDRAVAYMEKEAAEEWKELKKHPQMAVSETLLRYLYVRTLCGLKPDAVATHLLERAKGEKKRLTMYGKGVMAQVLAEAAATGALPRQLTADCIVAADEAMQSLVEHTVVSPVMGRYFDTDRALMSQDSYRIPTQTMALEALANKTLQQGEGWTAGQDIPTLQREMQLWLLQSKRTQQWESRRATADATYALLVGYGKEAEQFQHLGDEAHRLWTLTPEETAKAIRADAYNIYKEGGGLSWGSVRARYTLPVEKVEASGADLMLTRRWQVFADGKWTDLPDGDGAQAKLLRPGVRVRQAISVKAARDFDYVRLEAGHPASMEPVSPLSGNVWTDGRLAYRMVRDTRNDFFFEHLPKGTTEVCEEYFVTRGGHFSTGLLHVSSTIAPEFAGYAPASTLTSGGE